MREPKQDVCQFVISSGLFLQHCLHTMLPTLQGSNYKQESSQKFFYLALYKGKVQLKTLTLLHYRLNGKYEVIHIFD
jgi:hypothetical protein